MKYLKTSEIARIIGVHPNTVRLYEQWGFLPPIPRKANGYRMFNEFHLDQMQLARIALHSTFLGGKIRKTALEVIRTSAKGDLEKALQLAQDHLRLIQTEQIQANKAVEILEDWAQNTTVNPKRKAMRIKEAASYLNVTIDILRNWERNGLIEIPRDPHNGYRLYGQKELNRLQVIRALRLARYSMMSILRMLRNYDQGHRKNLREVLSTPQREEDIIYATDQWLSTLRELLQKAQNLVTHLKMMITKNEENI